MHSLTNNMWPRAITSPRLRVPLLAALAWLALAAAPARADYIVYTFTGDTGGVPDTTISGTFQIDLATIDTYKGHLPGTVLNQLQPPPAFSISDGANYNLFSTTSSLTVLDTLDYHVESANLFLTLNGKGLPLQITGNVSSGFSWIENTAEGPITGTGTFGTPVRVSTVPAPSGFTLFGIGACCAVGYAWRRRRLAVA